MESEHVLAKCRELGLPCGEDLSTCLERLERLLSNFAERAERKARARTCLRWIRDHAEDRSVLHEAMRLLSVYREEEVLSPPTHSDEGFLKLVVPEDPDWLPWIDKYSQTPDRSQQPACNSGNDQPVRNDEPGTVVLDECHNVECYRSGQQTQRKDNQHRVNGMAQQLCLHNDLQARFAQSI